MSRSDCETRAVWEFHQTRRALSIAPRCRPMPKPQSDTLVLWIHLRARGLIGLAIRMKRNLDRGEEWHEQQHDHHERRHRDLLQGLGKRASRSCSITVGRSSADDWDAQMMFFLAKGYRVIAHDRRGHGRSSQTASGNEMDTYAADVARWPRTSICGTPFTSAIRLAAARSRATSHSTARDASPRRC